MLFAWSFCLILIYGSFFQGLISDRVDVPFLHILEEALSETSSECGNCEDGLQRPGRMFSAPSSCIKVSRQDCSACVKLPLFQDPNFVCSQNNGLSGFHFMQYKGGEYDGGVRHFLCGNLKAWYRGGTDRFHVKICNQYPDWASENCQIEAVHIEVLGEQSSHLRHLLSANSQSPRSSRNYKCFAR